MPEPAPSDEGFTLIEILVTLVIMGISISAIMAGLFVATRGSGDTRTAADASAILTATAEQIERAPYEPCPTSTTTAYATPRAAAAPPADPVSTASPASVANLSVWDGDSFVAPVPTVAPTASPQACTVESLTWVPTASPTPSIGGATKMQRITLQHGDDSLTFIKRGP